MPYRRAGPGPRTDWEAESANALPAQHVRAARQVLTPNMALLVWRRDVNAKGLFAFSKTAHCNGSLHAADSLVITVYAIMFAYSYFRGFGQVR